MDTVAANVLLDAWLGAAKAAGMPTSFDLALFDGYPEDDLSNELDATGGYARVAVANDGTTWPAASGGVKTSVPVSLAGTATYGSSATYWRLFVGSTAYFTGQLEQPVTEPTDTIELAVFYGDEG